MQLTINNQTYDIADDPPRLLLWVLRDELGLTGTKFGCGAGICGACTVHVNGEPTRACTTPLSEVAGAQIRTVEGLAQATADGALQLHPIQQAFLEEQVPQCSWCMSGQMMTAVAFLQTNPSPTDQEITEAMSTNYCRCGCYFRVKTAVARAATIMREEVTT
ncbi:MAG: (2Fe-2S)-binding protein [Ardenticatenaceae bacterium]|nr:(2Fe-2S)-binding protein [Ardenticatenaceae bacterium]